MRHVAKNVGARLPAIGPKGIKVTIFALPENCQPRHKSNTGTLIVFLPDPKVGQVFAIPVLQRLWRQKFDLTRRYEIGGSLSVNL
jgi:hypothetical protein